MEQDHEHHERLNDDWAPGADQVELGGLTVRLRLADASDVDAMAAIELVSQSDPWNDEMFARELGIAWSHSWIVECVSDASGEIEAGSVLAFLVFWIVEGEAHILSVAVAPGTRRKGVAQWLLTEFAQACRARTVAFVTLEVRASNVGARALYAGLGFRKIGRRKEYYPDNDEDAVIMNLSL